jgi:hypothetical protein
MSVTNNEITNKKVLTNKGKAEFFWMGGEFYDRSAENSELLLSFQCRLLNFRELLLNSDGTAEKFRVVTELSACGA